MPRNSNRRKAIAGRKCRHDRRFAVSNFRKCGFLIRPEKYSPSWWWQLRWSPAAMRILIPPLSANVPIPIPMSTFGDPACFSTFSVRTEIKQIENINTRSAPAGTEDLANLYSKVDKTTSPEYFTTTKCSPLRFRFVFDRLTDFLCRTGCPNAAEAMDRPERPRKNTWLFHSLRKFFSQSNQLVYRN